MVNKHMKKGGADIAKFDLPPPPMPSTSISVYLLFLYVFIITMYCLFNQNIQNDDIRNPLESLGYSLLFLFEILIFGFIVWKIYMAYSSGDAQFKEKGIRMVDYIKTMVGSDNPFGTYANIVFYMAMIIGGSYLLELVAYMFYQGNTQKVSYKILFFFVIGFFSTVAFLFYNNVMIPMYILLIIGVVLTAISSILATISLSKVERENKGKGALQLPASGVDLLKVYNILTITCLCILAILAIMLFTKGFKLSGFSEGEDPTKLFYKINNSIVILLSLVLTILSSYNIYNTNQLLFVINNWKQWS